ncbi:MAG: T9SS type A sorting domain-containing protein, partial [Bacteroidales bacterium]|nr:T9SS type A sorting domain-containing protein [Bacteroidales bacterium]
MRKFYSFLGTILLGATSLFAQTNYTCTFSANVTMDSVQVKNTVSGEAKMLYSPDNLITLQKNGGTAIATVGNSAFLQKTANNVVAVNVETASQLNLVLYSISGTAVARYSSMVNAGQYSFQIGANAGVYVLVASAGDQSTSVKLSLTENTPIGITEITTNEPVVFLKSATDVITFNQGDVFEFTGYYQKQTDVKTAVITENQDIEFHFGAVEIVNGAIKAPFSVAEGKQVYFSMGNLQFNVKQGTHVRADGTTKPGTWRFAENQWDFVGTQTPDRGGFYGGTIEGSDNINLAWNYD